MGTYVGKADARTGVYGYIQMSRRKNTFGIEVEPCQSHAEARQKEKQSHGLVAPVGNVANPLATGVASGSVTHGAPALVVPEVLPETEAVPAQHSGRPVQVRLLGPGSGVGAMTARLKEFGAPI